MKLSRFSKTDKVRQYLLGLVKDGNPNPVSDVVEVLGLSRQAISKHMRWLVDNGYLVAEGSTRGRTYRPGAIRENEKEYPLPGLQEHVVYAKDFAFVFDDLPEEISAICHYGFTEMLNNAIDHSDGKRVYIHVLRDEEEVHIIILDDGEGIFKRIARIMELADPRESILELSKGKLTTDPDNHTGEGIFFTSRMFDFFVIESGELSFTHTEGDETDILLHNEEDYYGTLVQMSIHIDSPTVMQQVYEEYAAPDEYTFEKTVVPVRLALYEGEKLVSRSQAKRLLNRVEKFSVVMLDFKGVEIVGQGFADEVFRVFAANHPDIKLVPVNMTTAVEQMVKRVSPIHAE